MTARFALAVSLAIAVSAAFSSAARAGRRAAWRHQARPTGLPGDELMEYVCQDNNQYGIAQGIK
jgi:hypothetical protein